MLYRHEVQLEMNICKSYVKGNFRSISNHMHIIFEITKGSFFDSIQISKKYILILKLIVLDDESKHFIRFTDLLFDN